MKNDVLALAAASAIALGCSPWKYTVPNEQSGPSITGQTYKAAVEMMCDVDQLAELDPAEPEELADVKRFTYLEDHVDQADGIFLRTILSVTFGKEREELLREAQAEVGLTKCRLAETTAASLGSSPAEASPPKAPEPEPSPAPADAPSE